MKENIIEQIEEDIFLDDADIYSEDAREKEIENDELKGWEAAWMKGYEEAR